MEFTAEIETLIDAFKKIKGVRVELRKWEVELLAPDPDTEGEQEAFKQLDILFNQLSNFGFKLDVFYRGGNIDALRITSKENVAKYEEDI